MKKIVIVLAVIVAFAILPLVGNKVVKQTIKNRLDVLNSYGVATTLTKEDKGYLDTKLHYVLKVEDEEKFLLYLQQFASKQLPPYTKNLVDGVEIGVDVEYSNLPFKDDIVIDLYPKKLAPQMMQEMKQEAPEIYSAVMDVLHNKEVLYHIEYGAVSGEFVWNMKDFHKKILLEDKESLEVTYKGVHGNGKGIIVAPERIAAFIDLLDIAVDNKYETIHLQLDKVSTTTHFDSSTTYINTMKVAKLSFSDIYKNKSQKRRDVEFIIQNMLFDGSVNTQQKDAQIFSKVSMQKITIAQAFNQYILKNFQYEIALNKIKKESFIQLHKLLEKPNRTQQEQQQVVSLINDIAMYGLECKIPKIALEKIALNGKKEIKGFKFFFDITLPPSKQNKQIAALIQNIKLKGQLAFSKEFYDTLQGFIPLKSSFDKIKKEQNNQVIFDVSFIKGRIEINGEKI